VLLVSGHANATACPVTQMKSLQWWHEAQINLTVFVHQDELARVDTKAEANW
jgi:hypothetical protein